MKLLITQVRQKKKTVTENDEVLETARRKSSSNSNSKQKKKKLKQNLQVKKIKSY